MTESPSGGEEGTGSSAVRTTERTTGAATDGGVLDAGGLAEESAEGVAEGPLAGDRDPEGSGDGEPEEEAVEPVEVLVGLAEDGEIEPWDIDIVAVTDAYLERIDGADLRTSGRALFYAAVLLRMKSDVLLEGDDAAEEEAEAEPDPWSPFGADGATGGEDGERPPGIDPIDSLEAEMDRRLDRKSARGTPETLDELVRELRSAERERRWKESRSYDTSDSPRGFARGTQTLDYRADDAARAPGEPTTAEVTGTTHREEMSETVGVVRAALVERFERGRESVLFEEIATVAGSRVLTYLGLLFLTDDGEVALEQDELFGDLWIRDGGAATGSVPEPESGTTDTDA